MASSHYTFGDNDLAAQRLALLAEVYAPSSERLLSDARTLVGTERCARAIDLGCGPGYTTELVARTLDASETWGIDASSRMVDRARARLGDDPRFVFAVHDVTQAPMPAEHADAAFARHLLAHLSAPRSVLLACAAAVRPGGLLLLEEGCALSSEDPVFAAYYRCVQTLQAHYGQNMHVGDTLPDLARTTPWTVTSFERRIVPLSAPRMARLHAMNVRTWGKDPFAATAFDAAAIASMTAHLDAVAAGEQESPPVTCVLGQAVLRRDGAV